MTALGRELSSPGPCPAWDTLSLCLCPFGLSSSSPHFPPYLLLFVLQLAQGIPPFWAIRDPVFSYSRTPSSPGAPHPPLPAVPSPCGGAWRSPHCTLSLQWSPAQRLSSLWCVWASWCLWSSWASCASTPFTAVCQGPVGLQRPPVTPRTLTSSGMTQRSPLS